MRPEAEDFLRFLAVERNDSPHTVKAYGRDLAGLEAFLDGYYGGRAWTWAGVDRLALRGWLADAARRGWSKRTMARALSAFRSFYKFLNVHHGVEVNPARAASLPKLEKRLPGYLDRGAMGRIFDLAEARAADGRFESARNRAILEAKGEIIAYTDDDVVADPGWIKALATVFAEDPDVMAVTGLVVPFELETEAQVLFERDGGVPQ